MRLVSQGYTLEESIAYQHDRVAEPAFYAPATTQTLVNDIPMPQAVLDLKNRILAANEQPTCPAPASVLTRLKLGYTVAGALFNLQTLKDEHVDDFLALPTGHGVPMVAYLRKRARGVSHAAATGKTLPYEHVMPQEVVALRDRISATGRQPACPTAEAVIKRLKRGFSVAGALFNLQTLKDEHLEEYLRWYPKTGQNEVPMDVYLKLRAKGVGHDGAAHQAVKAKNKGKR